MPRCAGSAEFSAVIPGKIATGHGKHEYYHWPMNEGQDLRRGKTPPAGTSYFIDDSEDDFMGSWSPEEQGGMAHVADHRIVRGKKLWYCGTSPAGRLWETVLTDHDAPLVEPQAGAYSDNQPDYLWLQPGETKTFSHFWMPVREIGFWHYANLEGVLALDLEKGQVRFGWSPTGEQPGAQVVLLGPSGEFFRRSYEAGPARPVILAVPAPKGAALHQLRAVVLAAGGDTLLAFSHRPSAEDTILPAPEPPFPAPAEVAEQERLYFIGDNLERFRETEQAVEYYREALRRDPGDSRCNTALGIWRLKRGEWAASAGLLSKALERDQASGRARYHLGLALLGQENPAAAEKELNRASYDFAFYAAAQYELARLAGRRGDWEKALEHAGRSLRGNGDNSRAGAVKALILNRLGRHAEALAASRRVQAADPLELLAISEAARALEGMDQPARASSLRDTLLLVSRGDSYNHLELAHQYAACGRYAEAVAVLELVTAPDPLVCYHAARSLHLLGRQAEAAAYLARARQVSADYCFPSRLEDLAALEWAAATAPDDPRARALLGLILCSRGRQEQAIAAWREAVRLDPRDAASRRNLGYALAQRGELKEARASYEAAVALERESGVPLLELDMVDTDLETPREERLARLEQHRELVDQSDPLMLRLVSLQLQLGRNEQALAALEGHRFHCWEGGYSIHRYWVEANLRQGDQAFAARDFARALEFYRKSLEYPDNLEVKEQPGAIHARNRFQLGLALEALGRGKEAREAFELTAAEEPSPGDAFSYYRGKALEKLGRQGEARQVFERMLAALGETKEVAEQAGAHGHGEQVNREALRSFRRALALEGLGRQAESRAERERALRLEPEVALQAFCPPAAGW